MARRLVLGGTLFLALAPSAHATLVYQRTASKEIVAARNSGADARVIGHGTYPVVSPNGHHVAYFAQGKGDFPDLRLISIDGGKSRLLARHVFAPRTWAPVAWSPDSQYVTAADAEAPNAFLVNVRTRKRRTIDLFGDFGYGGAAFSPDSERLVIDNGYARYDDLYLYDLKGNPVRHIVGGGDPSWSSAGLAYITSSRRLAVRKRLEKGGRTVLRSDADLLDCIGWSRDSRAVLASAIRRGSSTTSDQVAIVVVPSTGAVTRLPQHFSQVDAIARHGHRVLGEANGDIVQESMTGTVRVLAHAATSPSWSE